MKIGKRPSRDLFRAPAGLRRTRRFGIGLLTVVLSCVLVPTPAAMGIRTKTFVVDCGNVSFLTMRPQTWSGGCTAGSGLVESLHWTRYGTRGAVATGVAVVGESADAATHTQIEHYRARFVMSRPWACPGHPGWAYFYTERLTVTYPADNPWGKTPGNHTRTYHPVDQEEQCALETG
jgi:hypothetical protein